MPSIYHQRQTVSAAATRAHAASTRGEYDRSTAAASYAIVKRPEADAATVNGLPSATVTSAGAESSSA